MGHYATNADVAARLPGRQLTAVSKPSTTDVDNWITQAEAELDAELTVQGLTTPVTGTGPVAILQAKVASYATARWMSGASAGTGFEGPGRDDAGAEMKEFTDFIALLRAEPARVATMLGQAPGTAGGADPVRSYITENADGLSDANGDFNPTFKRGMSW